MKTYNVAILGATGAVGQEMLRILGERNFPVNNLRLLASNRSAGTMLRFRGEPIAVEASSPDAFAGVDIVLGAAENDIAERFAPHILEAGAVFVDNSSAFRLREDVPLIVPEINPQDAKLHRGIISNPNCSTIIAMVAISGIARLSPIETMVASTYQAVSGAGHEGVDELVDQIEQVAAMQAPTAHIFKHPIVCNLIPEIGGTTDNGYTTEEMKMQNEGRKIMHLPDLRVSCTCVRVPVMRSHSISINLRTRDPLSLEAVADAIENAPGCYFCRSSDGARAYPTPMQTSGQDLVWVGCLRRDLTCEDRGLTLWCCGDQIRKGAATNAVQIAELLI